MPLSLKAELEIWAAALKAYDEQEFLKSIELFSQIADSSKILTNVGLIYATIGKHEVAVEKYGAATNLDKFLAVAYFQCGVSNFLLGRYGAAYANFQGTYLHLRGNQSIDYEQLGLKFKLFSAEVLFNRGLSQLRLGYTNGGMNDLEQARKEKVTTEHEIIDDAIRTCGERCTVFSVPVGVLYRPPEHKLRNSKSKDYLGKVKLVVGSDLDELPGVTRFKRYSESSENFLRESASNAYPNRDSPSTLKRRFTVPILHTRPIASSPPPERSELTNGVSETQIRGPSKVLDGECGRESAFGDDSVTTLQIPKPPSTISHHRTRTPESDTQPRSPQDLAGRFTHLFSVVRCRWKRLCKLVMVCNSTHRFSE